MILEYHLHFCNDLIPERNDLILIVNFWDLNNYFDNNFWTLVDPITHGEVVRNIVTNHELDDKYLVVTFYNRFRFI